MTCLLLLLVLRMCPAGPSLWPFLFLFWGACWAVLAWKGWL